MNRWWLPLSPYAHELRNEIVEELIVSRRSESRSELDSQPVRDDRSSGMESKTGKESKK